MKLLFINPSIRPDSPTIHLPVGLGSVMTYFELNGYDFDLLDIDLHSYNDDYVENYLSNNEYDIILFGSIITHYKWVKWVCKVIKYNFPKTKIIVGNSVAGSIPEVFLKNTPVDFAVIGEGEITALEIVNNLYKDLDTRNIEGIAYLNNGEFIKNPRRKACNVDDLPMINWELFEVEKYLKRSDYSQAEGLLVDLDNPPIIMPISTARGCAFKCTFCHYVFWDDKYRCRSPKNIVKEAERNITKYGASYFNFWDDLSFASLQQAERLVDEIIDSKLKFNWAATIRADLFGNPKRNYEKRFNIATKFKQAGCLAVNFALESGDENILKMMNKRINTEFFYKTVDMMKEVDIIVSTTVIFGYPIETKETIRKTFEMCKTNRLYPSIGYLMPLPYTGIYSYAKDNGFIKDDDEYLTNLTERQDFGINMTQLSNDELIDTIKAEALKLNSYLGIDLNENSLIKTGGYRSHSKETAENARLTKQAKNLFDIKGDAHQNPNDLTLNLNYAKAKFDYGKQDGT